ncbi:MAG TPA: hypothetical protein ACFCUC_18445 [Desulfobacterales bacterium]
MPSDFGRLALLISQHREFASILRSLRPGRLTPEKKALLIAYSSRIDRYLARDAGAREAWAEFMSAVESGYIYPLRPTRRQVIAASILAGAAIKRPNLELRPDLASELYQARAEFLSRDIVVEPGPSGGPRRIIKPSGAPRERAALASYQKTSFPDHDLLTRRASATGKLSTSIQKLLTDRGRSLSPLGTLRNLDHATIEKARQDLLMRKPSARAAPVSAQAVRTGLAFAPKSMAISLKEFRCVRQQETGTDEIFWAGNFLRCANKREVYEAIERFMKEPSTKLDLDFKWSLSSFLLPSDKSRPYTCKSGSPWLSLENYKVFEDEFYQGFGPWAGVLYCIEDDDAEYQAVAEVIDSVGEYADQIGQTASTVTVGLAAGGVTGPAALAAGAVTTAASVVSIGADVVGAVVDIVNFFDNDDMIDSIDLSDDGDYSAKNPAEVLQGTVEAPPEDFEESAAGALYQVKMATSYNGIAQFPRSWKCTTDTKWFPLKKKWFKKCGGIPGDSGNMNRHVSFSPPVQAIEARDVEEDESAPGHAEVVGSPWLTDNGTVGHVKVHWGISAFRCFRFKFYIKGFRFERTL